jgi:H+-translocating NAD(P) transhydrogenase subunit alpha
MTIGVPTETFPGERRVAIVPAAVPALVKAAGRVLIQKGAGTEAGYPDGSYEEKGAILAASREKLFAAAHIVLQVRTPGANPGAGRNDIPLLKFDHVLIGLAEPLQATGMAREIAAQGVASFALELMPRISRAQAMDVLSSMATVSGYKAAIMAADLLPRMFPMLMTAAGTVTPARVFVIGAGVAGLHAIATARRLGARVEAYDVRPAAREQVESLGARFVELPLEAEDAQDRGGYARQMDESFYRRQRELMGRVLSGSDVVITTAAVPGKKAPMLLTADMVARMAPGSVIVDLAAERGGNCELTQPDRAVVEHGVTILGPTNPASSIPYHASQMYSKNVSAFLLHLVKDGKLTIDLSDEITRETLVTRGGEVVHPRVRELFA